MKSKLSAMIPALFFPFLHLFVRTVVPRLAFTIELARARTRSPGLDEVFLRNQAALSARSAAPWLLILSSLLTLLITGLLLYPLKRNGLVQFSRPGVSLSPKNPAVTLTLAEIALGLNFALMAMTALLPLPESWIAEHADRVSDPLAAAGFMPLFLCTVIAAPLAEEMIFRGLCFRFLSRAFSPPMAVLWQAVLFAAFHGTRMQMVYVFPAAVVLGLVYLWCGTLAAPLVLHMAFNAVSLLPVPVPDSVWGQSLIFLAGAVIAPLGLRGLYARRAIPRAPANRSPRPPL